MNKPPAFQLYADDFLGGTMKFSDAEVGLYIRLLCAQWNEGSLPDDDNELLSYGKPSQNGTAIGCTSLERVKLKFKKGLDGRLRNERLEIERRKQAEFRINRSESGKAGASKRWHSHSTAMQQPMANGMANDSSPVSSLRTPVVPPTPVNGQVGKELPVETLRRLISAQYNRGPEDRWDYDEEYPLVEISRRTNCLTELSEILRFFKSVPEEEKRFDVAGSVIALLSKWTKHLDKARANAPKPTRAQNPNIFRYGTVQYTKESPPRRAQFQSDQAFVTCDDLYQKWLAKAPKA